MSEECSLHRTTKRQGGPTPRIVEHTAGQELALVGGSRSTIFYCTVAARHAISWSGYLSAISKREPLTDQITQEAVGRDAKMVRSGEAGNVRTIPVGY